MPSGDSLSMAQDSEEHRMNQNQSFWGSLKQNWRQLKDAPSGRRFRAFYDTRQENRDSQGTRLLSVGGGIALVVLGAGVGWLPGPGGFVAILGLALLAQEFRPLASALDWIERQLVALWKAFRSLPILSQGGIATALLLIGLGFAYLTIDTFLS